VTTTEVAQSIAQDLHELGFTTFPDVLSPIQCDAVIRAVEANALAGAGSRNLLEQPWCQTMEIGISARDPTPAALRHNLIPLVSCNVQQR
jgi:hypothetical protein